MRRFLFSVFLLVTISRAARAGEILVSLRTIDPALRGTDLKLIAQSAGEPGRTESLLIKAGEPTKWTLPDGTWLLTVATKGFWAPLAVAESHEGVAARVQLTIRPTVTVSGRVVVPKPAKEAIQLYFQRSIEDPDSQFEGQHVATGQIADDRVIFELPEGRFDLALRISGYTSVYRWDRKFAKGLANDLGSLEFRPGTTISGRIDAGSIPRSALNAIRIRLRRDEEPPINDLHREQSALREVTAEPTARGFFHFDVQPGTYVIQAVAGRYRSEEKQVTATATSEVVLREDLRLDEPRSLSVRVTPPDDPTGRAWRVTLTGSSSPPVTRIVSSDGKVSFEDLLGLPYQLEVGRGEDDAWYSSTVDPREVSALDVLIPLVRVTGTLFRGSAPLRARLSFLDETRTIRVWSRTDGRFAVDLPLESNTAVWKKVEVELDEPYIRAAVDDVRIEDGKVEIAISNRTIFGEVIGVDGRPASSIVTVKTKDGVFQIDSEDGTFSAHGLSAGKVSFSASSGEGATAARVTVDVTEDDDFSASVRLTLEPSDLIQGIVQTSQGPLSGAAVWCTPSMSVSPVVARIPTDANGAFHFVKPVSAERMTCTVSASGFGARLLRSSIPSDGPLQLYVVQSGAFLNIQSPKNHDGRRGYVLHQGGVMSLTGFEYLANARALDGDRFSFFVEEGEWSLCLWSDADALAAEGGAPRMQACHTVYAGAGATVELK